MNITLVFNFIIGGSCPFFKTGSKFFDLYGGAYPIGVLDLYLVVNRWKKIHCLTSKYKVK